MTLGTHADPALEEATAAAARAMRERLVAAGWGDWGPAGSAIVEAVPVLAEVAVNASWATFLSTISAWYRPTPGVLLDPRDVTVVTDSDGRVVGYRYRPEGAR